MERQDSDRGTDPVVEHVLSNRRTKIAFIDITIQKVDDLDAAWALAELDDPCVVLLRVRHKIVTHYIGAQIDGVYCTSAISDFVFDLLFAACIAPNSVGKEVKTDHNGERSHHDFR